MTDDIITRIKKRAQHFVDEFCLGQTVEDQGRFTVVHKLKLEFNDTPLNECPAMLMPLASKMVRAEKKIVLYTHAIACLLPQPPAEPSNSAIEGACARVILREIWWYDKGDAVHETTLAHLKSPESIAAFLSGYYAAKSKEN